MTSMNNAPKKEWVKPCLTVYGDMAALTQQKKTTKLGGDCGPGDPQPCKPKVLGFGDDFASNISTT